VGAMLPQPTSAMLWGGRVGAVIREPLITIMLGLRARIQT